MIYNPLDSFYKSIIGAVPENKAVVFRVKGNFSSVLFACKKDGENLMTYLMNKNENCFEISKSFDCGLYLYFFIADNQFIVNNNDFVGELSNDNENTFQLLCYKEDYNDPTWLRGGVIYQIFPDRFNSSKENLSKISNGKVLHKSEKEMPFFEPKNGVWNNDFFGGDLKGIINKFDYLLSLGVTCIYLNPIFKAFSNHRYDTANYFEIDELLGAESDLISLITLAHKNNVKVILDGVFNHVGADSLYFNKYNNYNSLGAFQSKNSPYYNWFSFKKFPNDYDSWWGVKSLPQIKKTSNEFFEFIAGDNGVIEKYLKLGIDGFRLDVVDELSNKFIDKIAKKCKQINPNSLLIGEVWEDASNKISYNERKQYFYGNQLNSVMNYPLKDAIIDFVNNKNSTDLVKTIKTLIDHYPKKVCDNLMNILSTHDTVRILSAISQMDIHGKTKKEISQIKLGEQDIEKIFFKLKIATLLQFTLFGVPSIYYGDEVGMQGFFDPFNRCFFEWENVGNKINTWYKFLSSIRRKNSVFADGDLEILFNNKSSIVFKRENETNSAIVCINLGENDLVFSFNGCVYDCISNKKFTDKIILQKNDYMLLTTI